MEAVIWIVLCLAGLTAALSTIGVLLFLAYVIGQVGLMLYRKPMTDRSEDLNLQSSPSV